MHKENLTYDIRRHRISRSTPNTLEETRPQQTIERRRFGGPQTCERKDEHARQVHRAPSKRIRQWHPPQVRNTEHQYIDRDKVGQFRKWLWWQAKSGRGRVDG